MAVEKSRPRRLLDSLSRGAKLYALFVDFDGTLVDIANTPDCVVTPPGLAKTLSVLADQLGGALAVVSGRAIADLDERLKPFRGRLAGVHGAEIRIDPQGGTINQASPLDSAVVVDVRRLAAFDSRILIEDKGASVAVHYRRVEDMAAILADELENYVASRAGLALLRGRKVFEVHRRNVTKGDAVASIMQTPAFTGRRPIMIGDDRTDLFAFEACEGLGGLGLRVAGELFPAEDADFAGPGAVRLWLADFAGRLLTLQETRA